MKMRLHSLVAAGLLALSLCCLDARAGQIPLPTTLDKLLPAGSFAVVGPEPDTYSNFSFSSSAIPPAHSRNRISRLPHGCHFTVAT